MYSLYKITSSKTDGIYIGITKNFLRVRFASHKYSASSGKKTPLYDAIRKYGFGSFSITLIAQFETKEECCVAEIELIAVYRKSGRRTYNLANGGEGGYVVPDEKRPEWIAKLKEARIGRTPSLGMKHTEENRRFFSKCTKRRVRLYPNLDVTKVGFREANKEFGISRTHYYRLLKQTKNKQEFKWK